MSEGDYELPSTEKFGVGVRESFKSFLDKKGQ
jgi:hypothetical protein